MGAAQWQTVRRWVSGPWRSPCPRVAAGGAGSSSMIRPPPVGSWIPAFVAVSRFRKNTSSGSSTMSPFTLTVIVTEVCPARMLAVPL
jgi:hypothetical protein